MVIAPLLGPNVSFSLATILGDAKLARSALKANFVGIFTAIVISFALGAVLPVNPETPEIASRTVVGLGEVALALASGSAGALAFTTGVSATLIGVIGGSGASSAPGHFRPSHGFKSRDSCLGRDATFRHELYLREPLRSCHLPCSGHKAIRLA